MNKLELVKILYALIVVYGENDANYLFEKLTKYINL